MVNSCIDFIAFKGPYSNQKWAFLYVYGLDFKRGIWLSIN
ncbi:hypothetical protein Slin_3689 [Spirosoma linguale DSM 74]|uniref:Uncharacterized protein n=1 Tax=Spirosoma linguale (strain ATCC 33905 / DSM 74 / LMG 10896 / Claus 1) TaxID=504472 RepID=D2QRE0_SPILD|nr:hypothetical protein Slin_3689 [Spirosoma linguale DSM 74]